MAEDEKDNIINRLILERDEARKEICELYCDFEFNKKALFMAPQEYAEFRKWNCFDPNKEKAQ
jgi:hypothetical protein